MSNIGKYREPLLGMLDTMGRFALKDNQIGKAYAFYYAADVIAVSNTFELAAKRINMQKQRVRPEVTRREEFGAYATVARILSYMY